MRKTVVFAALLAVASLTLAGSLLAANIHNRHRAWVGGTQNPQDFPNCFLYSRKYRNYVWICGPPYPDGFIHR